MVILVRSRAIHLSAGSGVGLLARGEYAILKFAQNHMYLGLEILYQEASSNSLTWTNSREFLGTIAFISPVRYLRYVVCLHPELLFQNRVPCRSKQTRFSAQRVLTIYRARGL